MLLGNIKSNIFGSQDNISANQQVSNKVSMSALATNNHLTKSDDEDAYYNNSAEYNVPEPPVYERPDIDQIKGEIKRLQTRHNDDIASLRSELSALRN